jgi:REP-associated tyrosine transposase
MLRPYTLRPYARPIVGYIPHPEIFKKRRNLRVEISPSVVETEYFSSQRPMDKFLNRYRISSARLQNWDYGSQGLYFVTICTKNRNKYFGEIVPLQTQNIAPLQPTLIGLIAQKNWEQIPVHFPFVELDQFQVMPDHLHGILFFNIPYSGQWTVNKFGPQSKNLGSVIRGYKASVKTYAAINQIDFEWQPRFHDHVIRSPRIR